MLLEIKGYRDSEFCTGTFLHSQVTALCGQSLRLHFPSSINCQAADPICECPFPVAQFCPIPCTKAVLASPVLSYFISPSEQKIHGGWKRGKSHLFSVSSLRLWFDAEVVSLILKCCHENRSIPLPA